MGVFQTVYDSIARLAGDAWAFLVLSANFAVRSPGRF